MLGIVQFHQFTEKKVHIEFQQNPCKYADLNLLVECFGGDPDLSGPVASVVDICKVIQIVYVCSGSDFTSYFYGQPKSKFYEILFQYSDFITSTRNIAERGYLANICGDSMDKGLLSFYRLVGSVYFAANRACLNEFETPEQLFNSFSGENVSIAEQHSSFLNEIRKASSKSTYEDLLLASDAALKLHWKRCCWVGTVWQKSQEHNFLYPSITEYGWFDGENGIEVEWDSPENLSQINQNVEFLTRGCGCKKSGCVNNRCKCVKNGNVCGPGCTCVNCMNTASQQDSQDQSNNDDSDSDSEGSESDSDMEDGEVTVDSTPLISSDVEDDYGDVTM